MIEKLNVNKTLITDLDCLIARCPKVTFYKDNNRVDITNFKTLNALVRTSPYTIYKTENEIVKSLLVVWKSEFQGLKRNYIKFWYDDLKDLEDLLMVFNWNYVPDIYAKIDNKPDLVSCFRKKGFRFCVNKGREVLLYRSKNDKKWYAPLKGDEEDNE
jgi:hypothetical protein